MIADPQILVSAIRNVLDNKEETVKMSQKFSTFARPSAARDVADMIISSIK